MPPFSGARIISRRAVVAPLRIASGTSFARPIPIPTRPSPSPTTTTAENENRRPPFTTFATRFTETTFSM